MGLFGNSTPTPVAGETPVVTPPGVDTITGGNTPPPPLVAEAGAGTFTVPVAAEGDSRLPTAREPITPVGPGAEAIFPPASETLTPPDAPTTPPTTTDPLDALNNTFSSGPASQAPLTPTVITPGEQLGTDGANALDDTPERQEEIVAGGQSTTATDGSLPAALVRDPVLGTQEPAISEALPPADSTPLAQHTEDLTSAAEAGSLTLDQEQARQTLLGVQQTLQETATKITEALASMNGVGTEKSPEAKAGE